MNDFAETIRHLRKRDGYTQNDMAEKLGISLTQYSNYELGKSYPFVDNLLALSVIFDVSADYLLKGVDSYFRDAAIVSLINKLREMDDDKKDAILFIADQLTEKSEKPKNS